MDVAVSPRSRSGVVLRTHGALRGPPGCRAFDRHRGDAMSVDPYLLVRAGSLYLAIVLASAVYVIRRPRRRELTGALLSLAWNAPALLALHVVAIDAGWWRFEAEGGLLLGMPIDLWLAWAILWGPAA